MVRCCTLEVLFILCCVVQIAHSFHNPSKKNAAIHHRHRHGTSLATSITSTSVHAEDTSNTSTTTNNNKKLQVLSKIAVTQNNGSLLRIRHKSTSTQTEMTFSLFLPSSYRTLLRDRGQSIPALYWLSKYIIYDILWYGMRYAYHIIYSLTLYILLLY